ncbi:hypothetical protein A1QO_15425 [Vibrio genomosp. F10 str. ZF-129]|uniref:Phage tail tape measure protein n=1 Tax=Vibrio genomosp. F10 str. ZF-129 TaxID=1187848 RepID=A0A1E5BA76_9VIBR|nr:hypothetical protein [Vibrio genomosp. F10]OEE30721.1 hypothetical protein A1QO_15425 [Vibrio genomosp. F10 str. ZF-129]
MKMNLSVVMGMKDKASPVLKGMASESDLYAKKIKKVQKAQADDASTMAMIDSYKELKKAKDRNNTTIKAEVEKLKQLKKKSQELKAPSAQLTERIAKQTAKLKKLTTNQNHNKKSLSQLRKHFSKTGITIGSLDDEYQRLNKRYKSHGDEINKLTKRYSRLKSALSPVQKLNGKIKFPKVGGAMTGKGAALLGGFSVAGLVTELNSAATEMDALAKKSATLKMSIGELQAMRKQASHAGVDEEAMSSALTRFTKRLGVLQSTESGILGSYLKRSGNSAFGDLKGAKDTQQAYEQLLQSFSKLETAQEQMAFADAAFGQDGRKMLLLLREGTDGLAKSRKELADLGGGAKAEYAAKAEAYNDALQRIQESIKSIKYAALAPIMEKATQAFGEFTTKFKNAKWRDETITKVTHAVTGLYNGLTLLGKGIIFVSQYFREIVAAVAMFKVAMIALNAVILANPIGLIVSAVMAAVIAIIYLVDKFIGLDKVIKEIGDGILWLWNEFKKLINKLPDSLIPDDWKTATDEAGKSVDKLANKMDKIKDKNARLGITTTETHNRTERQGYSGYQSGGLAAQNQYRPYQPLAPQTMKSKSEVSLTIKSDKPIAVDQAKTDKGTDLNMDVGNMNTSF